MISIQDSLNELDRCHAVGSIVLECYLTAIRNMAHYAVELDDEITGPHRKYLAALAGEVASAQPEALVESRATLRGLLRDYRDKAAQYLSALREELSGTACALEEILNSLAHTDGDHDVQLRAALARLREVSRSPEGGAVRAVVLDAADSIERSLEQVRKQHQLTVAQFRVEIGMLHKRIDALETAAALDDVTKLFKREEIEREIRSASGEKLCLLLVRVSGFRRTERQFDHAVAAELVAAFTRRLRNSLPPNTAIGRWSEEGFIAMLSVEMPQAVASAKWVAAHLSGAYACLQRGKTVRPSLQASVAVVDNQPGEPPERTLERVKEFLTGA
ncbi:MAG: GGDEF domain-containing protein [Bryobacteraceae bacterium]|jgi:GGDEF domain-containing protein